MEDDKNNDDQEGQPEETYEWSAFRDDEGRIYYYNNSSGESAWDPPEKFNPPPEEESSQQEEVTETNETVEGVTKSPEPATETGENVWEAYKDDDGNEYFYNSSTGETTWDKPASLQNQESKEETEPTAHSPKEETDAEMKEDVEAEASSREGVETSMEVETEQELEAEPEPEPEVDSEEVKLEKAIVALQKTDAIMEPGVMNHVTTVVTSNEGNPQSAIQALSESYFGETAVCGLLGRWLVDLKSQSADSKTSKKTTKSNEDFVRQMAEDMVNKIADERFTKTGGDSILDLSKSEAAFLETMIDSNRWRRLLIDLTASNKDSALLMYCLEQISKKGHHREIARRINQSDHFTVFNAMLSSELSVVGRIAVSACKHDSSSITLEELSRDLLRACSSTGYTYIYAVEVLQSLVKAAKKTTETKSGDIAALYKRASRKWECLAEMLQRTMIDPASSSSSTPLFRKRRLDVAVTTSELHQRQRRRLLPTEESEDAPKTDTEKLRSRVESGVLSFLRRYSLGSHVGDRALDDMLPQSNDPKSKLLVGTVLLSRPLTIEALLGYMYKPGSLRIASAATRRKCGELVALSVHAAELSVDRTKEEKETSDEDDADLAQILCEGSNLCETLENMVSFVVLSVSKAEGRTKAAGETLCELASKHSPVARGVAVWARALTEGGEFVHSASYPTLSLSILSLIRVTYLAHPFIRDDVVEIATTYLKHSNNDISYQKMNEIKEQSLRLLLFLLIQGEAQRVLDRIAELLQGTTPFLDASLIRFFVASVLEVSEPPFSLPFSRSLCKLLKHQPVVDCVKTTYFSESGRKKLKAAVAYLFELGTQKFGDELSQGDQDLLSSLKSIY